MREPVDKEGLQKPLNVMERVADTGQAKKGTKTEQCNMSQREIPHKQHC